MFTKVMNRLKLYSFSTSKIILRREQILIFPNHLGFHTSSFASKTAEEIPSVEPIRVKDVLEDLKEPELTEEEILRKRFQSRLPERIHKLFIQKKALPIEAKYNFAQYRLRGYWARFGSQTKLNPGICWPTREEILETIESNKIFEPPLQERLDKVHLFRSRKEERQKAYEAEVDKNMANSEKWIAEYHARIAKQDEKAQVLRSKREQLVEEISEYLGYEISPKDPRFKEAVEQRDKAKKKELKAQKQKESYDRMLEKLKKIAQKSG